MSDDKTALSRLPSVDRLLRHEGAAPLIAAHGRAATTEAIRAVLDELRAAREVPSEADVLHRVAERIEATSRPSLRPVFNLTGTVLHTNLGRAPLPEEAVARGRRRRRAAPSTSSSTSATGERGERDDHVEAQLLPPDRRRGGDGGQQQRGRGAAGAQHAGAADAKCWSRAAN